MAAFSVAVFLVVRYSVKALKCGSIGPVMVGRHSPQHSPSGATD